MLKIDFFKKLRAILARREKKSLFLLSLGSVLLSVSEVFSIGIIIPIIGLFINQEKIHTSKLLSRLYQFSAAPDVSSFLIMLICVALAAFYFKAAYSVFMLYAQQRTIGRPLP